MKPLLERFPQYSNALKGEPFPMLFLRYGSSGPEYPERSFQDREGRETHPGFIRNQFAIPKSCGTSWTGEDPGSAAS